MTQFFPLLALTCLLSIASCKNTPSTPPPNAQGASETPGKSSVPDAKDLLNTLQGRWRSEQDATYLLEITDTQMWHYHSGKLTHQSMVDVDGACESPVCKSDGVDTSDGWCFTEMSVEGGKYTAQCNFVTLCDTAKLQYRSLGGTGAGLSFRKIQ